MVQQSIIIPCGELYRAVCVLCNSMVFLQLHIPYAGILIPAHGLMDNFRGAAIGDDQLPVFIRLSETAFNQCLHIHALRLVCRYENREFER